MMLIREEQAGDQAAIYAINEAAFGRPDEAQLVDRLRVHKAFITSLVAIEDGRLVGHALFTPVLLHTQSGTIAIVAGLGPVAVLPAYQNKGIGKALIETGIELCREAAYPAMIVLGHPSYYPRFGFQPASRFQIASADAEVPEDAFMALELKKGGIEGAAGVAYYHPEFGGV
jgi:putative acetyltransferase